MLYMAPFDDEILIEQLNSNGKKELLYKAIERFDNGFFDGHEILNKLISNNNLDALLLSSLYSKKDESESMFYKRHILTLEELAELNHPLGLYVLGVYYDTGQFVSENKNKAEELFKLSSELGLPQASFIYGIMLYYGTKNINPNKKEAVRLLKYAASKGIEDAKVFLDYLEKQD